MDKLRTLTPLRARFSEVDMMAVAWHGSYVKYLEDGREDFGKHFGLEYMTVYDAGFMTPIVRMNIEYKSPLFYGKPAEIETVFINSPAAKIRFEYTVKCSETGRIIALAWTEQVFINAETRELELTPPEFFIDWKKKNGLQI
ncbi:MAG TPA: thioesterase family protein [bacterium]|nr:thioesterase family protein [bacterium]HPY13486.1 thioesterase family protein [bacterium]HQB10962.1 thioesterase family protein [bacterium]